MLNENNEKFESERDEEDIEREIVVRKSKAFEEMLRDLSISTAGKLLKESENAGKMVLEKVYVKAIKEEQGAIEYWYDVGETFKVEIEKERNEIRKRKQLIR